MKTLADAFSVRVGWSDHTPGWVTAVGAVALGAAVVEKHFTLDKSLPGPDHAMSLDPLELKGFVAALREAASALGDGVKIARPCEEPIRLAARRSLVLRRALKKGTVLTDADLAAKRPGTGLPPSKLDGVLGRALSRDKAADEPLTLEDLT